VPTPVTGSHPVVVVYPVVNPFLLSPLVISLKKAGLAYQVLILNGTLNPNKAVSLAHVPARKGALALVPP